MNDHRRCNVFVHLSPQFKFKIFHISTCKTKTRLAKPYHCVTYILEPYLLLSNSKKNQWLQNAVGLSQASTSSDGKPKKPVPLKTRENKGPQLPLTPTILGNLGNLETLTTWPPKLLVSVTATSTAKLQCLYTHPYLVTKNSRFSA